MPSPIHRPVSAPAAAAGASVVADAAGPQTGFADPAAAGVAVPSGAYANV